MFSSRTLGLGISFVLLLNVAQSQAARIDVYSGQELQQAIQAAVAGDEIVLQPGGYESEATSALSGFANAHYFGSANGTAQNPIILRSHSSTNRQILRGTTNTKKNWFIYHRRLLDCERYRSHQLCQRHSVR